MWDVRLGRNKLGQREKKGPSDRALVQILALGLAGLGLLVMGAAAWVFLSSRAAASTGDRSEQALAVPVVVDFPAPGLELTDLQGNPVSLDNLRGQYTLVNHWATWCPPCKAEMPTLQAYYEDNRHLGFTIVAIDAGEALEVVDDYVQRSRLTFPVWIDPDQRGMAAFKETYLPSSYVMDPSGQVVLYWGGAISRATLDQYLTPLLEKNNASEG